MSFKRRIFLFISFAILDIVVVVGFLCLYQVSENTTLRNEINELSQLNILNDRYNRPYKCMGGYKIVEKTIKDYLDDFAVHIQEVSNLANDSKLNQILSLENIKKDSPSFEESLKYIDNFSKDYNQKVEYLLSRLNEDTILNSINSETKDPYFRNLYKELMLEDDNMTDFFETKELLMNTRSYVNDFCNNSRDILTFLRDHADSWFIEDEEIKFKNHDEYEQYMSYLSKINLE